jgi:hypothetical protein
MTPEDLLQLRIGLVIVRKGEFDLAMAIRQRVKHLSRFFTFFFYSHTQP